MKLLSSIKKVLTMTDKLHIRVPRGKIIFEVLEEQLIDN